MVFKFSNLLFRILKTYHVKLISLSFLIIISNTEIPFYLDSTYFMTKKFFCTSITSYICQAFIFVN